MDYTVWQLLIIIISFGMVLLSVFCVIAPQKLIHAMPHLVNSNLAKYSDIAIRFFFGDFLSLVSRDCNISINIYPFGLPFTGGSISTNYFGY